jgi:hypothetical protein
VLQALISIDDFASPGERIPGADPGRLWSDPQLQVLWTVVILDAVDVMN